MTPVDHVGHLGLEALAEYAEGLLAAEQAAAVRRHLARCVPCRRQADALAEVSSVLAELRIPPMPAEVATRLEAALAAEAAGRGPAGPLRPATTPGGGPASPDDGPHARAPGDRPGDGGRTDDRVVVLRRRRSAWSRPLAIAAGLAVVVGGVAVAHTAISTHPHPSAAHAPRRAGAAPEAEPPGSRDSRPPVLHTGTDYTAATLSRRIAVLTRSAGRATDPGTSLRPLGRPGPSASGTLAGCVAQIARTAGGRPVVVDVARYDGRPATVIVVSRATGVFDVWVVGPRCSRTTGDVIAHTAVPRGA